MNLNEQYVKLINEEISDEPCVISPRTKRNLRKLRLLIKILQRITHITWALQKIEIGRHEKAIRTIEISQTIAITISQEQFDVAVNGYVEELQDSLNHYEARFDKIINSG